MTFTEDVIIDLKQFIVATVSQQLASQNAEIEEKLTTLERALGARVSTFQTELEAKIDGLSTYIADALDISHEATHKQLNTHERRITKLEKVVA